MGDRGDQATFDIGWIWTEDRGYIVHAGLYKKMILEDWGY